MPAETGGPGAGDHREARPGPGRIVVVGSGRVGQSVAASLAEDAVVTVVGRSAEAPALLRDAGDLEWAGLAADDAPGPPAGPARYADTLVFCVPDDALPDVAAAWADAAPRGGADEARGAAGGAPGEARTGPGRPGTPEGGLPSSASRAGEIPPVALHTSGVHPPEALGPLRSAGWRVGGWHPLIAVASPRTDAFRGVTFGLSGDAPARERGRGLARAVGGRWIHVGDGENARYHAAAVFASNFLVACLSVARRELEAASDASDGLAPLLPLARSALENLEPGEFASGVTGPVARGDAGTVRRHLAVLDPGARGLYRRLARELLGVVEGRLDPDRLEALRRALEEGDAEGGEAGEGEGEGDAGRAGAG